MIDKHDTQTIDLEDFIQDIDINHTHLGHEITIQEDEYNKFAEKLISEQIEMDADMVELTDRVMFDIML